MSWSVVQKFLGIILLSLELESATGCSCFPVHPQVQFCSSAYVFVGTVLSEKLIPGRTPDPNNNDATYDYQLRVISNLQGNIGSIGSTVTIDTRGNGALCGRRLGVGSKLLMAIGPNKRVGLCSLVRSASSLTYEQMMYFFSNGRNSYKRNCICRNIREKSSKVFSSTTGCKLPASRTRKSCYFSTALCRSIRGRCRWRGADCGRRGLPQ